VSIAVANQYTDQLSHAVRAAVIGNAGSLIVFRGGGSDWLRWGGKPAFLSADNLQ
jgi:hypothetical protein